jgi:N utilization substance protein B
MPSRRHLSRIAVMQTLFEMQARTIDSEESLLMNIKGQGGDQAVDGDFCQSLLLGIQKSWDEIREAIQRHAPQWPLERMDSVTRSILMVGAYELLFAHDAPPAVVMNEAIEIAKQFGNEESGKFVNGVLNALAQATKK